MSNWKRTRKIVNDIHLWLGIASGLLLFVVCVTGTVYTFHEEIVRLIDSDRYYVSNESNQGPLPVEDLVELISNHVEGAVSSVIIPNDHLEAYKFSVKKEGERRGTTYLVNPYSGDVLGDTNSKSSDFFMVMFRMHRWLLLDTSIGRPIVGWSTVVFVIIILSGLIIWVPKKVKNWRQGLKIKWSANWKRINHDLHNALGLYTAIFLLIMALTGLQWSFSWYRAGLRNLLNANNSRQEEPIVMEKMNVSPLNAEELLQLANVQLPYEGTYWLDLSSKEPTTTIRKYHTGFFASPASDVLLLNKYTGAVIRKEIFSEKPLNEKIARSIKALHVGDVFGAFSKIVYFISCLIATSLPITGTLIWINKLKKKSKRKAIA